MYDVPFAFFPLLSSVTTSSASGYDEAMPDVRRTVGRQWSVRRLPLGFGSSFDRGRPASARERPPGKRRIGRVCVASVDCGDGPVGREVAATGDSTSLPLPRPLDDPLRVLSWYVLGFLVLQVAASVLLLLRGNQGPEEEEPAFLNGLVFALAVAWYLFSVWRSLAPPADQCAVLAVVPPRREHGPREGRSHPRLRPGFSHLRHPRPAPPVGALAPATERAGVRLPLCQPEVPQP